MVSIRPLIAISIFPARSAEWPDDDIPFNQGRVFDGNSERSLFLTGDCPSTRLGTRDSPASKSYDLCHTATSGERR